MICSHSGGRLNWYFLCCLIKGKVLCWIAPPVSEAYIENTNGLQMYQMIMDNQIFPVIIVHEKCVKLWSLTNVFRVKC